MSSFQVLSLLSSFRGLKCTPLQNTRSTGIPLLKFFTNSIISTNGCTTLALFLQTRIVEVVALGATDRRLLG